MSDVTGTEFSSSEPISWSKDSIDISNSAEATYTDPVTGADGQSSSNTVNIAFNASADFGTPAPVAGIDNGNKVTLSTDSLNLGTGTGLTAETTEISFGETKLPNVDLQSVSVATTEGIKVANTMSAPLGNDALPGSGSLDVFSLAPLGAIGKGGTAGGIDLGLTSPVINVSNAQQSADVTGAANAAANVALSVATSNLPLGTDLIAGETASAAALAVWPAGDNPNVAASPALLGGRPAGRAELEAAIANGLPPSLAGEPASASTLSPTSRAIESFFKDAGGQTNQLSAAIPETRGVLYPSSIGLNSDGTVASTAMTRNDVASSGVAGSPLASAPNAGLDLLSSPNLGRLAGLNEERPGSDKPGTAKRVEGLLSNEEQTALHSRLREQDPKLNNYMVENNKALSGAALQTYARGQGGLVRLPNDFTNSKIYYQNPAAENTATLVDRVLNGQSRTPGTENALERMKALKPGESFTFNDSNNKLIDMRGKNVAGISSESPTETDRMMTLGNATFNTNAQVTITNAGAKGYQIDVKSVHAVLDRYNWNATEKDSEASAARTSALPDGSGGTILANHADWAGMKARGAKDYTVGLVTKETRQYTIPRDAANYGYVTGESYNPSWESGKLGTRQAAPTKTEIVTDPASFRTSLGRASAQNKNIVPVPNEIARPLTPLKYIPGAGSFEKPTNPSGRGQKQFIP
jgi:hypothetical protein